MTTPKLEADKELASIIQNHSKQIADKKRGYPAGTQDYFTANQLLAWRDKAVKEAQIRWALTEANKMQRKTAGLDGAKDESA